VNPNEIPIPTGAEERSWQIACEAFLARTPNRSGRRHRRSLTIALVAAALALLVTAASLSATNSHVIVSIRRAIGVTPAPGALTRLPTGGRLLVNSTGGAWIVGADGTKRHLGANRSQAAWSPHGLFEAALLTPHTLAAIDPEGAIRWTLDAPHIGDPRWSGDGYRIAYRSGTTLRVVAGDGTDNHALAVHVAPVASAWQGSSHRLAYLGSDRRIHLINADTTKTLWRSPILAPVVALAWNPNGGELLAATGRALAFINPHSGKVERRLALPGEVRTLAVAANGSVALSLSSHRQSSIELIKPTTPAQPRVLFRGAGLLDGLAWSPNGRWLLAAWPTADQWLFVNLRTHPASPARVQAVASITRQFESSTFPQLAGWCCSGQPQP